ncbi:MAG: hypothetical protein IPK32_04830 [Verrucomicrobiaceae bacterium]|nr:hypothetical protein [Verrucomicrobiaceae bacterium]
MKRKVQAICLLLLIGIVKLPLEQRATNHLRSARLLDDPVPVSALESMGQSGLTAILGGLRGLVASMLQLRAYTEFKRVNWAQVDSLYRIVTRLQPRNETYWDEAAWHMAWNAASYYLYNAPGAEMTPQLRGRLREQHIRRGEEILKEGLTFSPDSWRLWDRLADLYYRRSGENAKAGDAYMQAYEHGAPNYTLHAAGFNYVKALDAVSWRKGYDILKKEYDRGRATPGLIEHLKTAELLLKIPRDQCIPDAMPVPKVPQKMVGPMR